MQDAFKVGGIGTVVSGRVASGVLKPGDSVCFAPHGVVTQVRVMPPNDSACPWLPCRQVACGGLWLQAFIACPHPCFPCCAAVPAVPAVQVRSVEVWREPCADAGAATMAALAVRGFRTRAFK